MLAGYRRVALGAALCGFVALGGNPVLAHHNNWALPLVGGAVGGYALGTLMSDSKPKTEKVYESPAPVYYTPPPHYVPVVSASTIEAQLAQLDKLAAGGYITPEEYKTRRQALLNQL